MIHRKCKIFFNIFCDGHIDLIVDRAVLNVLNIERGSNITLQGQDTGSCDTDAIRSISTKHLINNWFIVNHIITYYVN